MKTFKNPFAFFGEENAEAKTRALMQASTNEKVACDVNGFPQAFFTHVEIPKKERKGRVLGDSRARITYKEIPLIAHKPILLIECAHNNVV
jgi:hypothetical protein